MIRIAAVATLAALSLHSSADEIDDFCRDRWGVDYVMREFCIKEQRESRTRVLQAQQLSPEAEMEKARMLGISKWLHERRLPFLHDEIVAIASTNGDAGRYIECERRAREITDDGTTRLQRLYACLPKTPTN